MIEQFTYVQVAVAVLAGLLATGSGLAGRTPNDYTLGGAVIIEVLLIAQLVVALIAPAVGNVASGDVLEFYVYLVSALLLPPLAVVWALVDRSRWSTVVVGVMCFAVAVMVYRMNQIWLVQVA